MVEVVVAEAPRGHVLCIGIERAIEQVRKTVRGRGEVLSFEPAHELELRARGEKLLAGVSAIEATMEEVHAHFPELEHVRMVSDLERVPDGAVLAISARGVAPSVLARAKERGLAIVQGTCPYVLSQEHYAKGLVKEGYDIVYCGSPEQHGVPRLRDIAESAGRRFFVAGHAADVDGGPRLKRAGVMAQTTQSLENLRDVVGRLLEKCHEVKVVNSICDDAMPRQEAARRLAEQVDVMLVLGESWGASRLFEVCQRANTRVYRAVRPEQLRPEWLIGATTVGIAAGNAVPEWVVPAFVARVRELASPATSRR